MPADKLALYKISGNTLKNDAVRYIYRDTKSVAQRVRAISTYRILVHGVTTHKVPSCLTNIAHYFLIPMTRSEGSNMCRSIEKDTEKYKEEKNKVNKRNYWYIIYMKLEQDDNTDIVLALFVLGCIIYSVYIGDKNNE